MCMCVLFILFHFWFTPAAMPGPVRVSRPTSKKEKKKADKKLYGRTVRKSLRAKGSKTKREPQLRKVPFSPLVDLHPNLQLVFFG